MLLVVLRGVEDLGLIALSGAFLAQWVLALPAPRVRLIVRVALGLSLAVLPPWVLAQAAEMAGSTKLFGVVPLLPYVLLQTEVGRASLFRGAILLLLTALQFRRKSVPPQLPLLLAALAWLAALHMGHAAAPDGPGQDVAFGLHILAAAAWVGGLLPLLVALSPRAARRFSWLGGAAVLVMVASGVWQAWFLAGGVVGLLGTRYGHVLLAKCVVLLAMLGLAAINRLRYTPRLPAEAAMRGLRRSILLESGLGAAAILLAGWLSQLAPGAHEDPVWPLSWQIDPATLQISPAYPTSFQDSPTGFTRASVAAGRAVYGQHCAACHGSRGWGDGPLAASLPARPRPLTGFHLLERPDGEMFWLVSHGMGPGGVAAPDGTRMPGFENTLSSQDIWNVIDAVRAMAGAQPGDVPLPAHHHH